MGRGQTVGVAGVVVAVEDLLGSHSFHNAPDTSLVLVRADQQTGRPRRFTPPGRLVLTELAAKERHPERGIVGHYDVGGAGCDDLISFPRG